MCMFVCDDFQLVCYRHCILAFLTLGILSSHYMHDPHPRPPVFTSCQQLRSQYSSQHYSHSHDAASCSFWTAL